MKAAIAGHSSLVPTREGEPESEDTPCRRLRRAPLFAELDAATLAALGSRAVVVRATHGTSLVEQGVASKGLIVLVEGSARVSVQAPSGRRAAVAIVHAVETFGESCLIGGGVQPVSVELAGPGVVVLLDGALLRASVDESWLTATVLRRLLTVVRETNRRMAEIVELDVQGRVARALLDAVERSPEHRVTLTEGDVADLACASRGAVMQAMRNFDRLGWIDRSGGGICVNDPEHIARLARVTGTQ